MSELPALLLVFSVNNGQFCLVKKLYQYLSDHTAYFAIETKKKEIIIKSFTQ